MVVLVYSANGLQWRKEQAGYVARVGEVIFPEDPPPGPGVLAQAFPGYTAAVATVTAAPRPLDVATLVAALLAKGVLVQADINAAMAATAKP